MYAVIRQGGHQYRVQPGDVIQIEKIEAEAGEQVQFEDVLVLRNGEAFEIGEPRVNGAAVNAKVIRHGKGRKVRIYKMKRRKGFEWRMGHRQPFVEVRILSIARDGKELK